METCIHGHSMWDPRQCYSELEAVNLLLVVYIHGSIQLQKISGLWVLLSCEMVL